MDLSSLFGKAYEKKTTPVVVNTVESPGVLLQKQIDIYTNQIDFWNKQAIHHLNQARTFKAANQMSMAGIQLELKKNNEKLIADAMINIRKLQETQLSLTRSQMASTTQQMLRDMTIARMNQNKELKMEDFDDTLDKTTEMDDNVDEFMSAMGDSIRNNNSTEIDDELKNLNIDEENDAIFNNITYPPIHRPPIKERSNNNTSPSQVHNNGGGGDRRVPMKVSTSFSYLDL